MVAVKSTVTGMFLRLISPTSLEEKATGKKYSVNWCGFITEATPFSDPITALRICGECEISNYKTIPVVIDESKMISGIA